MRGVLRSASLRSLLPTAAATVLLATACGGEDRAAAPPAAETAPGAARLLAPGDFARVISRPEVVSINVHVPDEGSLPGTDLEIPFDRLAGRRADLPPPPTPIAVYCRTGRMSATAVDVLARMGYERVAELRGGMVAWERDGRPLLRPAS